MLGIKYDNDGENIEIVADVNLYHFVDNPKYNLNLDNTIFIQFQNTLSFIQHFVKSVRYFFTKIII